MKLDEVARRIECELEAPGEVEIRGVASLEEAGPEDLSFLANPKYRGKAERTGAGAVIVGPGVQLARPALLRAADPYLAFARAVGLFHQPPRPQPGVHPSAVVASTAKLGRNASIGPHCVIEEHVVMGDDCVLKAFVMIYPGARIGHRFFAHSHAVVRENVQIGDDVILQNGAVVGADGFGFARQPDGSYTKILQPGPVIVEDGVEIQANSCIDRPSVGATRLRHGVKVDNLVQVGHGCDVGENTLLCAQVGLAGSSKVGKSVILTGQVGLAGHLSVGDNAVITPQSGVPGDVAANAVVSGSPAIDHTRWLKASVVYSHLPEIHSSLRKIRDFLNTRMGANL
jgi:UDP-3-O-[3-hydroxymyristoyl] glucosamine N-acyltransferase